MCVFSSVRWIAFLVRDTMQHDVPGGTSEVFASRGPPLESGPWREPRGSLHPFEKRLRESAILGKGYASLHLPCLPVWQGQSVAHDPLVAAHA